MAESMNGLTNPALLRRVAGALLITGALSACSSSGGETGGSDRSSGPQATLDTSLAEVPVDEVQDPRAYCPKAIMRAGTETFDVYPDGMKDDDPEKPKKLRFRATITDIVRECNSAGPMLKIKVGVAGRVLSGPSGEAGSFQMPVRVALTRGNEVLYSQLHDITAEVPAGRTNNTFSYVDGNIVIPKPDKENIVVYAGFDAQRVDIPGANASAGGQKPIN
jgi:hypothetical protein